MADDKSPYQPILVTYGGVEKSSFDMTSEEFEEAARNITRRAKEKAFSKGLPIYTSENGHIYAEYADGRKEIVPEEDYIK